MAAVAAQDAGSVCGLVCLGSLRGRGLCSGSGTERPRRRRWISASRFLSKLTPLSGILIRILLLFSHRVFCVSGFVDDFG